MSYASIKSPMPKGKSSDDESDSNGFKPRNAVASFHGQNPSSATHQNRTDLEAKLFRKGCGKEARLSRMGHAITEDRHGQIHGVPVSERQSGGGRGSPARPAASASGAARR